MSAERTARANEEGLPKMRSGNLRVSAIMKVAPASPVTRTRLWRLPCSILNAAARGLAPLPHSLPSAPWLRPCRDVHRAVPPGGPVDTTARFTPAAGPSLVRAYRGGQQTGAGGIGREFAAKAEPDGCSLFASIHHAVLPSLRVTTSATTSCVISSLWAWRRCSPSCWWSTLVNSVSELIAYARLSPASCRSARRARAAARIWPANVQCHGRNVVDNKSGAGGIVGAQFAAKAEPDGYSLFFASIHHAVLPSLRDNLSYDILRDFEPVGMAAVFPIVLVVNPSMPVNSVSELIAYGAQPGKLSFSSSGTGGGIRRTVQCQPEPGSSTCRIAAARPPAGPGGRTGAADVR